MPGTVPFSSSHNPLNVDLNRRVIELARRSHLHLYIVGGCLRDCLVAEESGATPAAKDVDFAVSGGSAFQFARALAAELKGHFVALDEESDTARVVVSEQGTTYDFAGLVGGEIEKDLLRRDFTVNALALDPDSPETLIDLTGGARDLKERRIKAVAEQSLIDDPLRVLRGYRFAAMLNAEIESGTASLMARHAQLLSTVAVERINLEFFTTLKYDCAPLIERMGQDGVLETIFPELKEQRRVTANAFHHLGLFDHSVETIPQLEKKLPLLPQWMQPQLNEELSSSVTRLAATKAACILHDVGKPQTWEVNEEGRHTFYGHDKVGADMCEVIAERLKWSNLLSRFVVKLVKWHLRPGALFHQGPPTDRAVSRFYRSVAEDTPELMLLAFADLGATRGQGLMGESRKSLEESLEGLLAGYYDFANAKKTMVRLLTGTDVMKLLSIQAGPVIGEILKGLEEAQEFKEVVNRAQAERFVLEQYRQKYCK